MAAISTRHGIPRSTRSRARTWDGFQKVWEFRTGDLPQDDEPFGNQNTPVKIGDRLYDGNPAMNKISALDAATEAEFWTYDPGVSTDNVGYNASCRGLVVFDNPAADRAELCASRTVNLTHDARMIALDTETGSCARFRQWRHGPACSRALAIRRRAFTRRPRRRRWCAMCWWWAAR